MNAPPKLLIVDDTPTNIKLLADLLAIKAMRVYSLLCRRSFAELEVEKADRVLRNSHAGNERLRGAAVRERPTLFVFFRRL